MANREKSKWLWSGELKEAPIIKQLFFRAKLWPVTIIVKHNHREQSVEKNRSLLRPLEIRKLWLNSDPDREKCIKMTISYTGDVANASGFGCFNKILLKWKGSVYKLIYKVSIHHWDAGQKWNARPPPPCPLKPRYCWRHHTALGARDGECEF